MDGWMDGGWAFVQVHFKIWSLLNYNLLIMEKVAEKAMLIFFLNLVWEFRLLWYIFLCDNISCINARLKGKSRGHTLQSFAYIKQHRTSLAEGSREGKGQVLHSLCHRNLFNHLCLGAVDVSLFCLSNSILRESAAATGFRSKQFPGQ